jgi:PAS domain-containing protein
MAVVAQHDVELILMKLVASYLAMPVFLVEPGGSLLYYNEPAEAILGRRYEESGEMPLEEWSTVFVPTDESGDPIPPEALPLARALTDGRPAHGAFWITGLDGIRRHIAVTAFPLIGQNSRNLGSVAIFWEGEE